MATLAVFAVPLVLLHATYGQIFHSEDLNIAGTDAINDVIRYYNNNYNPGVTPGLKDVHAHHQGILHGNKVSYNVTASQGILVSKGIKLAKNLADVSLEVRNSKDGVWEIHTLTADFPITIKDLKLQYYKLDVKFSDIVNALPPRHVNKEPEPAVKAFISKNKFALQVKFKHFYKRSGDGNTLSTCIATLSKAVPEEFEVKNVTISGMVDPWLEAQLTKLANQFKEELAKETHAEEIITLLFEETTGNFFRYCSYYPQKRFESYMSSL